VLSLLGRVGDLVLITGCYWSMGYFSSVDRQVSRR
jgi:hypothetical protein